ncbi:Ubp12 protein [Candida orthopsilosis Co 90-125]|uniref:ubiquitinyl hydrolase 1 n=1 Tax=Candida orthopsilosis (strain 90-125) TaxID=1136231 RepID=H8WY54_CANO9|nr:Ubp12 protein [Candida orthopsilosis Co 90-125]CCG21001.1 Ubp12 protein [Candida orthopsilosis Co 90-125]
MPDEEHQEITSYNTIQEKEEESLSSSTSSIKSTPLESPVDVNVVSNGETNADNGEELQKDLESRRQLIKTLLADQEWQEGDDCYVIPKPFIDSFFNTSATSIDDLRNKIGPIDFHTILDNSGYLFSAENEPVPTLGVSQNIFQHFSHWFGVLGQPVERSFIINPVTGVVEIERWPLECFVHYIGKKTHQPTYFRNGYSRHSNHHDVENERPAFLSVSRGKTFLYLLELIKDHILKAPRRSIDDFRLWFVTDPKQDELPFLITATNFAYKISSKNVVPPTIFNRTLMSEGVNGGFYHLVIEYKEKSNLQFPIDAFVQSHVNTEDNKEKAGGHMGLSNLGNTCYMNSALQCLLHVPEINQYFFHNIYQKELNVDNPLGYNGDVANAFGSLLKQAFDPAKTSSSMSPRDFKYTIGRYSSMFSGYLQQDSQELLSWLLDALHEDLNRIQKKPYCEKPELKDDEVDDKEAIARLSETCWNQHKQRNDSVITDLFTGLYESILVCPDCGKTSITFDPFNDLTLPLPINKKWYHTFTIVDFSGKLPNRIMKLEVELKTTSNYDDLVNYLSNFLSVATGDLFLYEVFQHGIYADFQKNRIKNKFLPITEIIKDGDDVVVYIIPHDSEIDVIIPVFNVVENEDTSYRMENYFGVPLFITLTKDQLNSFGCIRQKLLEAASILTYVDVVGEYEKIKQSNENYTEKKFYNKSDFTLIAEDDGKAENEYDSDVSLANPYVDADFGFKIKYIYDSEIPSSQKSRFSFNSNSYASATTIHVPLHKPAISSYKLLSGELPQLKRQYYHSQQCNDKPMDEVLIEDGNLVEEEEDDDEKHAVDDYLVSRSNTPQVIPLGRDEWSDSNDAVVSIDEQIQSGGKSESDASNTLEQDLRPTLPPRNQQYSQLILSDTESEGMLGSGSFMPPQASSVCPDSTKPSNINSPLETNFDEEVHTTLVSRNSVLLCDWDKEVYLKLFGDSSLTSWESIPELKNQQLAENKARFERQRKSKVTLADCLKSFSTPEVLGEHDLWYCPSCNDHKRATKSIQIWSTGDILTIHLKRFHSARAFSDKIDIVVDFPIEGLDIAPYVANPTLQEKDCIYDLIAVDNHYGGLGGGHYTASVKNFKDDKWYYFNDSRVTEINNPEELVSSAAYLLFYRRKRPANEPLGGDGLRDILRKGEEEYKSKAIEKQEALTNLSGSINKYHSALRFNQSQDGEVDYESELSNVEVVDEKSSSDEDEVSKRVRRQRVLSKDGDDSACPLRHSNSKRQKMNSSAPEDADISSQSSDSNGDAAQEEVKVEESKINN